MELYPTLVNDHLATLLTPVFSMTSLSLNREKWKLTPEAQQATQ